MAYDDIKLPAQQYDIEWEDKSGNLRQSVIMAKTASEAERRFTTLYRREIATVLCVEPTE